MAWPIPRAPIRPSWAVGGNRGSLDPVRSLGPGSESAVFWPWRRPLPLPPNGSALKRFISPNVRGFFSLFAAVLVMLAASMLSPRGVRRIAVLTLLGAMVLMLLTLVLGQEAKVPRATRIAGLSLQPSEFVKPALAVFNAWMLAEGIKSPGFLAGGSPAARLFRSLDPLVATDFGMSLVVASVFGWRNSSWPEFHRPCLGDRAGDHVGGVGAIFPFPTFKRE